MLSVNNNTGSSNLNSSTEKSIAVLPFVNMSTDTENEYFSDGITEEIINYLFLPIQITKKKHLSC